MDQHVAYFKNNSTYTFNNTLKLDLMNISFRVISCNYKKNSLNTLNLFIKGEFLIKYKKNNKINRFNNFNSFNKFNKSEIILSINKLLVIDLEDKNFSKLEIDFLNIESSIKRIANSNLYRIDLFINFFITSHINLNSIIPINKIRTENIKNDKLKKYNSNNNFNETDKINKNNSNRNHINDIGRNNIDRNIDLDMINNESYKKNILKANNNSDAKQAKEIGNKKVEREQVKLIEDTSFINNKDKISEDNKDIVNEDNQDRISKNNKEPRDNYEKNLNVINNHKKNNVDLIDREKDNNKNSPFYFLLDLNLDFSKESIFLVKNIGSKILIEKAVNYDDYICLTGKILISVDYITKEEKLNFRFSSQSFSVIDKGNLKTNNVKVEVLENLSILEIPYEEGFKRLNLLVLIKALN